MEGLVWTGFDRTGPRSTGYRDPSAGVLVLTAHLRAPGNVGELRVGRFVESTGAIRPVQLDGASAIARAPSGTTWEAFGGVPVVSWLGDRSYDWVAGGRLSQSIASRAVFGVSYMQQRDHGELAYHEVGADASAALVRWFDLAGMVAYDVDNPGITDATFSSATPIGPWRFELFGSHRSPGRLLPATSLFSVLGDVPSSTAGATASVAAAPRLDLLTSLAVQSIGGALGVRAFFRSSLKLDDDGHGRLGFEVRREGTVDAHWAGIRAILSAPIGSSLGASTELELARTGNRVGDSGLYPWALVSLSWSWRERWQLAGALEAASTPLYRYELDGLVRLSYRTESAR
jgi:hypothetical protein